MKDIIKGSRLLFSLIYLLKCSTAGGGMHSRSRTALRSPSSWLARAPSAFAAAAASVGVHQRVLAFESPLKENRE